MAEHVTTSRQTIWDLSHQLYGDSTHAVQILKENPGLGNLTKLIPSGSIIEYTPPTGNAVAQFFY